MKFTGSIIGKIFLILICIILGIVIALGGLVGGLYFVLTRSTMGQIEERVGGYMPDGVNIEFSEDVKDYTVLAWSQELMSAITDMDSTTIDKLEGLLGYAFISNMLYETIGVDAETVKSSTLGDLGTAITNSLTVEVLSEKFGIGLPDMPLFNDAEFLSTPVSKAFEDLDSKKLSMFVDIKDGESNAVLVAIKDLTISDLGGEKLNNAINGLKLGDVIDIDENSNSVLYSLKDTTIGELGSEQTDEIVNSLFVCEVMHIDGNSQKILQALQYSSIESVTVELDKTEYIAADAEFRATSAYASVAALELPEFDYIYDKDGTAYVYKLVDDEVAENEDHSAFVCYKTKLYGEGENAKNRPLIGFNDNIGKITFGDVVNVNDSSGTVMRNLKDARIVEMDKTVDRMFLDEMVEITDDSPAVLKALRYSTLEDKIMAIGKNSADAMAPGPEYTSKELDEYLYKYSTDKKGNSVPYVCVLEEDGTPKTIVAEGGVVCYQVYETKDYAGYFRPIIGLNKKLDGLTLFDVFTEEQLSEGVLSLLPAHTKLNDISTEVSGTIQASSLAKLAGVGVIDATGEQYEMTNSPKEQRAFIWNNSMNGMIGNLIEFVENPLVYDPITHLPTGPNYEIISPSKVNADGSFASLTAFVETYLGTDYAEKNTQGIVTVVLQGDVTVTIDETLDAAFKHGDAYYIPVFNLDFDSSITGSDAFTLTFNGADVILAMTENGASEISAHQFYYAFDASNYANGGSAVSYYDGTTVSGASAVPGKNFREFRKVQK